MVHEVSFYQFCYCKVEKLSLSFVSRPHVTFNPSDVFPEIIEELIGEGRVKGQVSGSVTESAIFIPSIHSQTQNQWIENFFKQNDYLGELE